EVSLVGLGPLSEQRRLPVAGGGGHRHDRRTVHVAQPLDEGGPIHGTRSHPRRQELRGKELEGTIGKRAIGCRDPSTASVAGNSLSGHLAPSTSCIRRRITSGS